MTTMKHLHIYRILLLGCITLVCNQLSAQRFVTSQRVYRPGASAPVFDGMQLYAPATDLTHSSDYKADYNYSFSRNASPLSDRQISYTNNRVRVQGLYTGNNTFRYNSSLRTNSSLSAAVSDQIMNNLAVPMSVGSVATIGVPSNPGDGPPPGGQTVPNGPLGDALLPLLALVAAFVSIRLIKQRKQKANI